MTPNVKLWIAILVGILTATLVAVELSYWIADVTTITSRPEWIDDPAFTSAIRMEDAIPGEQRGEYFFLIRSYLVVLAAVMMLAALVTGLWARGKAIPLSRLRYQKLLLFGTILPLVVGGVIMYFNLFGATAYSIGYVWPGFVVNLALLSCAMLYITLAMTRKYVNRYCHRQKYMVPPFQRWPGFLNIFTLLLLLVTALLPPSWWWAQFAALGWVVLSGIIHLARELKCLRELTRYPQFYRLAAGTAYWTLCLSALFVSVVAVPLWWYLESREFSRASVTVTEEVSY